MTHSGDETVTISYRCACGAVSVEAAGTPILHAVCYCDDCQAASDNLARLLEIEPMAGPDGGTDYVLWRKDRVRVRGDEYLWRYTLKDGSITRRAVAGCCNTPMFIDFEGPPHWYSLLARRFAQSPLPVEMRINARFAPDPAALPEPKHDKVPISFILRLIGARIAMLFGR